MIRGQRFLAFTTTVVIQAFQDIAPFAFVMFIIVLSTALAFIISPNKHSKFSFLTTYALLLGDFDQDVYFSSPWLTATFFVCIAARTRTLVFCRCAAERPAFGSLCAGSCRTRA